MAWWLATLMLAAWVWAPRASGAEASEAPVIIGSLPVPDTWNRVTRLAIDSPAGIAYEIGGSEIQMVSLETGQLVGRPVPLTVNGITANASEPIVDEVHHRLFIPVQWVTSQGFKVTGLLIFDGVRGEIVNANNPLLPLVSVAGVPTGLQIDLGYPAAITYDADADKLYVAGYPTAQEVAGVAAHGSLGTSTPPVSVVQFDLATGARTSYVVVGCLQVPRSEGLPLLWDDALWLVCAGSTFAGVAAPNISQGAFRIELADGELPTEPGSGLTIYPITGYYGSLGSTSAGGLIADPAGGRILLAAPSPGPAQIFVFDATSRRVVGLMGIDPFAGVLDACVDNNGRFYLHANNNNAVPGSQLWGLLVGEARGQGSPYPQVAGYPEVLESFNTTTLACDWVRHQVIALASDTTFIPILRDYKPPYEPPPPLDDPDLATTGGPYDPETSRLAFSGDGRGFGAQVKFVGGYDSVLNAFSKTLNLSQARVGQFTFGSLLSPSSPKITLGSTGLPDDPRGVILSDTQSTAAAQGMSRDGGLVADMALPGATLTQAGLVSSDSPEPLGEVAADPWVFPILDCAASPGEDLVVRRATGVGVSCDPARLRSAGMADTAEPLDIPGVIRVVGAGSNAESSVDHETGTLTTRTSTWVRSISLGDGEIEISDVLAEATAIAGGQAGTALATLTRTIGQMSIGGEVFCGPCDPAQVADGINAFYLTRGAIRASAPAPQGAEADEDADAQHYEIPGTPGGAQSALLRTPDLQLEDQAVNEQSPYDQQVPTLRLELANDSLRHLEMIIDLAAPQATSRLQILPGEAEPVEEETTTTTEPLLTVPEPPVVPPTTIVEPPAPEPTGPANAAPGFSPALVSYTPPSSPTVVVETPPVVSAPPAPAPAPVMPGVLGDVESGLRAALASPSRFFSLLLVWAVMAVPVYLVARRRLVIDFVLRSSEVVT